MDEYVGLSDSHPASFRAYQKEHFLSKVTPKAFHGIQAEAADLDSELARVQRERDEAVLARTHAFFAHLPLTKITHHVR